MSAIGQLDPLLARAQMSGAPVAAQSIDDPLMARAMGQNIAPPQPPPMQPAPGQADTIMRNVAGGGMFGLADVEGAAIDAAVPSRFSGSSNAPSWWDRFKADIPYERQKTAAGSAVYPKSALASSIVGGAINPVTRALPVAKTLGSAILQGGAVGGAYGAGNAIGNSDTPEDFAKQAGVGMLTGGALGAGTHGLGALLKGGVRTPEAQMLHDEGVPLTVGQSLGGTAKTVEDGINHIPLLGNAIKARQGDAIKGFNVAAYNRVLEPLGINYEASGPVGNEGIDHIGKVIGDAYDKAYQGATVLKTPTILDNIDSATDEASNLLPKDKVSQIQANINRLVTAKFDEDGVLNSNDLQTAKNFFAEQSRAGPTASLEERAVAKAYGNAVDALKGGIAETDPSRGDMLNAADTAYMRFVRTANAASSNASSARGGVFTPSQFGAALRSSDNSVRHLDFARGVAPMQDLAQAGQQVLPSSVPDSGTATRGLMELAPWLVAGAATRPMETGAAASALGAGTALYSSPGQSLARSLLFGAPGARKAMAKIPQALLPGMAAALIGTANSPSKLDKDR